MSKHFAYLWYVVRHKWFVLVEGLKLGVPLWRLIIHDWTKFLPDEWFPYVDYFYNKEEASVTAFDFAFFLHQKRHDHHWQWWVMPKEVNEEVTHRLIEMSEAARLEMLADWRGAGKVQGKPDTLAWYKENKRKMLLHPVTKFCIEKQLARMDSLGELK